VLVVSRAIVVFIHPQTTLALGALQSARGPRPSPELVVGATFRMGCVARLHNLGAARVARAGISTRSSLVVDSSRDQGEGEGKRPRWRVSPAAHCWGRSSIFRCWSHITIAFVTVSVWWARRHLHLRPAITITIILLIRAPTAMPRMNLPSTCATFLVTGQRRSCSASGLPFDQVRQFSLLLYQG